MIVYFSGTGNSRYCAQLLSQQLSDEAVDAGVFIKAEGKLKLRSDKPWVFASPTYSWQLPKIFKKVIEEGKLTGNKDAYFIMTCGESIGAAPVKNKELCEKLGMNYKGTLRVVMPENYIAMFDVPSEEKCKELLKKAQVTVKECADIIKSNAFIPEEDIGFKDKLMTGIVNSVFYPVFVKNKKFTASDKCVSCGKCSELCPLNSIEMKNGKPDWKGKCTHCMACISYCPAEAIEYGKISKGKRRYICPDYTE